MPAIDPAWWTSGSHEGRSLSELLASRDFGAVFGFLRQRGWSVGAISAATQIDEYPIREIIKGKRQVVAYDVIERIVVGLGIERHLCGIGVAAHDLPDLAAVDDGRAQLEGWLDRAGALDAEAILTLRGQTDQIRRIDRLLGAQAADLQLRGHLGTLSSLRSFSITPVVRKSVADLFCDAATLAGWVALDLGDVAAAWSYHEVAKDAGRETGSALALAHTLAQQAYVLVELGKHAEARLLAEHAVEVGGRTVPAVLVAWLRAVVGEVAAVCGDETGSRRNFEKAARLLPADPVDPDVPYIMLDAYHLARWQGTALARLGDLEAIVQLNYALTGMDPTFVRAKAQLHIELAHSLIAAHHQDEAARHLEQARTLAIRVGSVRQRRRLRKFDLALHHTRR
jgi:tetratricopeptide (TPR) repeat protein